MSQIAAETGIGRATLYRIVDRFPATMVADQPFAQGFLLVPTAGTLR